MEGKFFKIRCALSGLVLDIEGKNYGPGARVTTWEDTDGDNQLWYEDHITDTIRSKMNDFCLEITPAGAFMNPYHPDEPAQHWVFEGDRVHNVDSPLSVLDISGSDPNPGANLCAWDYHGGPNQIFSVEYQIAFFFFIVSTMNGKVLDIDGGDADAGTKVIMYDKNDSAPDNQLWYEDRYGVIRSKLNDFALDYEDDKIRMNPYDPMKSSQQWLISGDTIRNKLEPNKVLDIEDEDSWNGAHIVQYDYSGNSNQLWSYDFI